MSSIFRKISLQKMKRGFSNILEFIVKYFGCMNRNCIQYGAKIKKAKRKVLVFCFFYVYATWFISSSFTSNSSLLSGRKKDGIVDPNNYANTLGRINRDIFVSGNLVTKPNTVVDKFFAKIRKNTMNLDHFKIDNYSDNKKVASIKSAPPKKIPPSKNANQNNSNQNGNLESAESNNVKTVSSTTFTMSATAYDLSPVSCGKGRDNPNYGITASGKRATARRTIAVDPNVIPLGTCVRIIFPYKYSYLNGVYIAEDTGGAIKGNIIDIFMGEDKPGDETVRELVYRFGVQKIQVEILK